LNKAKIITAEEAGISNKNISKNALNVVQLLQDQGYQAYLVGGCVRDLLLDKKPKDFDVSTNATPEQIKTTFKRNARIIGRRFKIVHVRYGYEVIEVATFRADANDRSKVTSNEMTEGDQGQLLRDNVYGTIEEDVVRRDFRVNALYYDSVKGEILDFMNGIDDIRAGKLISIGEPKTRFTEDPVRMLRVIRFSAKLGFEMEPEALEMIEQEGQLLSHVSSARLFEEVLKLFHGGAAYETYLLLRKYGIFKYLFPFTDQIAVAGVEGMPERALQNTDKRVRVGKPVIPAFLFACMMWDPVKADAQMLMDDGTPEAEAWRIAMSDGLRDQNQYVAVPRRLAEIILDIWNIHFRLIKRNPRMVKASLGNRRFRAAYDFLLLRTMVHEVDEEISEWWTEIQELDAQGRDEMIAELNASNKSNSRSGNAHDDELDGNSINYNSIEYQNGNNVNQGNSVGKPKAKQGQRRQQNGRRKSPQGKRRGRQAKTPNANAQPGNGNSAQQADPNKPKSNPRRGKKRSSNRGRGAAARGNGGGRGPNNRGGRRRADQPAAGRFQDARPKDDYGNHSTDESTQKKVKVRHKRRVVGAGPADEDKPIF
jgi:poly(A) polymerase